jgi:hypothetical protein
MQGVSRYVASEQDLAQIPWIGAERARALVQGRPYREINDVRRVPGFNHELVDELVRGGATVGNPVPAGQRT